MRVVVDDVIRPSEAGLYENLTPKNKGLILHKIAERTLKKLPWDKVSNEPLTFTFSNKKVELKDRKLLRDYFYSVIESYLYLTENTDRPVNVLIEQDLPVSHYMSGYTDGRVDALLLDTGNQEAVLFDLKTGSPDFRASKAQVESYLRTALKEYGLEVVRAKVVGHNRAMSFKLYSDTPYVECDGFKKHLGHAYFKEYFNIKDQIASNTGTDTWVYLDTEKAPARDMQVLWYKGDITYAVEVAPFIDHSEAIETFYTLADSLRYCFTGDYDLPSFGGGFS